MRRRPPRSTRTEPRFPDPTLCRSRYFSKEVLPYIPEGKTPQPLPVFHHVGVYAYRPEALAHYTQWGEGSLEANEGLEQLRFLENGEKILCVEVEARGRLFWELNNPVDRSEEHTSELQSLMRISYAVFCLKKKQNKNTIMK